MAIIATANESKTFTPAPDGGHQAVCVDVIDLGQQPDTFNPGKTKHKIEVAWQIGELREDGSRFVVYKRYTLSLHEKATLRHDLESWRGRPFTDTELKGFDVETVKGANCLINIAHQAKGERTYANVVAVMPLVKGMSKIAALNYERRQAQQQTSPSSDSQPDEVTDDDIPF